MKGGRRGGSGGPLEGGGGAGDGAPRLPAYRRVRSLTATSAAAPAAAEAGPVPRALRTTPRAQIAPRPVPGPWPPAGKATTKRRQRRHIWNSVVTGRCEEGGGGVEGGKGEKGQKGGGGRKCQAATAAAAPGRGRCGPNTSQTAGLARQRFGMCLGCKVGTR